MDQHPLVIADKSGFIRHWSEGAATTFGYRADQALGQTLDLIVPLEYREAHWKGFRRAMETGAAEVDGQNAQFPVQRADGSAAVFSGAVKLLRSPQNLVIGAMVIFDPTP